MEFNIGDRVTVKKYNKPATVTDKLYSHRQDAWMYMVQPEDGMVPLVRALSGDELTPLHETKGYRFDVFTADSNVVTAVMYEVTGSGEREIDRQHGHIIHEGMIGVAQAASYALKKLYTNMNGGQFIEREGV